MKKYLLLLILLLCSSSIFAKTFSEYLAEAKNYETQKRWCYALGSYYDAMGTDEDPEKKQEAYERYKTISDAIISGKPGLGNFNDKTMPIEWKNLLIDAEKYASTFCIYNTSMLLGYNNHKALFNGSFGNRYKRTVLLIDVGYEKAYKSDWTDIPSAQEWPEYSASSNHDEIYDVNGALVSYVDGKYLNAFACGYESYEFEFNIVDINDNEITKTSNRRSMDSYEMYYFKGISSSVMDLIIGKKAFISISACYLKYGNIKGHFDDWKWISATPKEASIPANRVSFGFDHIKLDEEHKNSKNFKLTKWYATKDEIEMENLMSFQLQMLTTEVTKELYDAVMGEPVYSYIGKFNLSETDAVFWTGSSDNAISFCNELSKLMGLTPVYTKTGSLYGNKYERNTSANGFRLPTGEEWESARNINTEEWCDDTHYSSRLVRGKDNWFYDNDDYTHSSYGFRIVRPISPNE